MKKIVSLILVLMLVLSMSAALAQTDTTNSINNACTVKLMYTDNRTPFVTWTFPSEIIVNVSKDGAGYSGVLAQNYFVEVSDLAIKSSQVLHFGFGGDMGLEDFGHAVFQNAPLSNVNFAMNGATRLPGNNSTELNNIMEQGLKLQISLQMCESNSEYQSASSYVINGNAVECGTATINFAVAFEGNNLPGRR